MKSFKKALFIPSLAILFGTFASCGNGGGNDNDIVTDAEVGQKIYEITKNTMDSILAANNGDSLAILRHVDVIERNLQKGLDMPELKIKRAYFER